MTFSASLSVQLITIAIITLQRQLLHNEAGNRNQWNSTYDYVVIGSGSAGAIMAARLTEDPAINVLLVEAGGPQTVITDAMPNTWVGILGENDWHYMTTPQRRSGFGFENRRLFYPRGRVLGGSSTTNYALYIRGNRRDFDEWANTYGATGWSYAEVLPYFLRTENQTNPIYAANTAYHSTSGQMPISSPPNPDPIMNIIAEAWGLEGYPFIDFNGPTQKGTTFIQQSVSPTNWTRASAASSFIEPLIRTRNNLHVITRSLVTRIILQNTTQGLTATGIEFLRNGIRNTVDVRREVILSAGAINSPQILMLSGIGPKQHLREVGIPVQLDLPVGNNLMDHILVPMNYLAQNPADIWWSRDLGQINTVQNMYDYFINNDGPLTRLPVAITYLSSKLNDDPEWPDTMVISLIAQIGNIGAVLPLFGQRERAWADYWDGLVGDQRHFFIAYSLVRPRSRGTVRLASTNPMDAPLIDPNYFDDKHDLATVVDTMRTGMRILEKPYFRKYARIYHKITPGCYLCNDSRPYYECVSYLTCLAQTRTATYYHPVGTCRMGRASDPLAVVDNQLRVRGVNGLRVVDASVMPKEINANTMAATMMIAERAADWVRFGR